MTKAWVLLLRYKARLDPVDFLQVHSLRSRSTDITSRAVRIFERHLSRLVTGGSRQYAQ